MSNHPTLYTPVQGKTYSPFAEGDDSEGYFAEIKHLTDAFLQRCPDEKKLLGLIQKAGKRPYLSGFTITKTVRQTLPNLALDEKD